VEDGFVGEPSITRSIKSVLKENNMSATPTISHKRVFSVGSLILLMLPAILLLLVIAAPSIAQSSDKTAAQTYPEKPPEDPFKAQLIPRKSRVYIAPMKSEDPNKPTAEGFEGYVAAALRKKNVPLIMVADRSQADFIIEGSADKKGAGWAKKIFLGDFRNS